VAKRNWFVFFKGKENGLMIELSLT